MDGAERVFPTLTVQSTQLGTCRNSPSLVNGALRGCADDSWVAATRAGEQPRRAGAGTPERAGSTETGTCPDPAGKGGPSAPRGSRGSGVGG